jgi:hypothetical protein
VDRKIFQLWGEVVSIASAIEFSEKDDELVWQLNLVVVYSSQSLYSVINFRGVQPVFIPAVWKLLIPPEFTFS